MRGAIKSATPWRARGEGALDSFQALLLNRKSPIPISISNLKFQSQFPIPSQFPFSISILKSLPKSFEKETCKPPPTRGGTPPSGRAHSAGSDHFEKPLSPFWLQNR